MPPKRLANPTTPASSRSFAKLDMLRCAAVLLVLFAHLSQVLGIMETSQAPFFRLGRLGVLFFFVHTCIVLMMSLERHHERYGRDRILSTFAIRRLFRIFPLSIVVLTLVYVFRIPAGAISTHSVSLSEQPLFPNFFANIFLVQNMVSENPHDPSILAVLWSLPFEIEMYLFLPILFFAIPRATSLKKMLLIWFGTVFVAFLSQLLLRENGITFATFDWGTINYPRFLILVPSFFAGVIAYSMWNRTRPVIPFFFMPILMTAIALLYRLAVSDGNVNSFIALSVGMVGCLVLALFLPYFHEPRQRVLVRTGEAIARYSYGIYLLHLPCIWFAFDKLKGQPLAIQFAVFAVLLSGLCYVAYHFVEEPLIRFGQRLTAREHIAKRPVLTPVPLPVSGD